MEGGGRAVWQIAFTCSAEAVLMNVKKPRTNRTCELGLPSACVVLEGAQLLKPLWVSEWCSVTIGSMPASCMASNMACGWQATQALAFKRHTRQAGRTHADILIRRAAILLQQRN